MKKFFTKWVGSSKEEPINNKPTITKSVLDEPKIGYFGDDLIISDYIKNKNYPNK